jgi:hypothetical protein
MTDRMKKTGLLLLSLAAACGPAATTTTGTGNTGGGGATGGGATELWAAVLKPGATFGFRDSVGGEDVISVDATVKDVTDVDGGKAATIAWSFNGEPEESSSLPKVIVVTATGVRFQGDLRGEPGELAWPASLPPFEEDKDGGNWQLYIHDGALKGEVCYGEGPGKNAGECEDVCFAELCVHPTHGLTGGSGTWWPNMSEYIRRDLSK